MTRAVRFYAVLSGLGIASFAACSSGDGGPIGDNVDASGRNTGTSGSRASSGTFGGGGSSGSRTTSSGSAGSTTPGDCAGPLDCPTGQQCVPDANGVTNCQGTPTGDDGGGSSSGASSSSGNPSGKAAGESCTEDSECQSAMCVTSKDTGVFFCSKSCTRNADNYDPSHPGDATKCPANLPLCGDEAGRDGTVCRADV